MLPNYFGSLVTKRHSLANGIFVPHHGVSITGKWVRVRVLYHNPVFVASTDGVAYTSRVNKKAQRTKGYYTDLVTDYAIGMARPA